MKRLSLAAGFMLAASATAMAQTAIGVGVSKSDANALSASQATAIGGGNAVAKGGTGVGVGTGGNSAANVAIATNPANTTANVISSGTTTVRSVPSVFAPGLAAAGLETCLGSVSGGGSVVGTGLTFGTSIPDPGCAARLDARTLWAFGLKRQAINRLCQNPDIARAMPENCPQYVASAPVYAPAVYAPLALPPLNAQSAEAAGGPIMLVEGATGRERPCAIYLNAQQRCQVWADARPAVRRQAVRKNAPAAIPARLKADPPPVAAPKTVELDLTP